MAKKSKVKKTLVDQILDKAKIDHDSLSFNGLEGELQRMWRVRASIKPWPLKGIKQDQSLVLSLSLSIYPKKKLAKISGNKKVQMIPQKDLQKTTGYVHGANNPVGIRQKHNFPIYIDHSAQDAGFLIVSAGEIGRSIRINSQELADFVNAEFADIKE